MGLNWYVLFRAIFVLASLNFLGNLASASPTSLNYQGRIMRSDGTPLQYESVSFIFQLTNPSGSCVIYQEQLDGYNMKNSGGVFDVPIGTGTVTYPTTGSFGVIDAFNNSSSYTCKGGNSIYTASSGDLRKLRVQFYDGIGWRTISPDSIIRTVPFAGYAASAEKLGPYYPEDFFKKSGTPNCPPNSFLTFNGTHLVCTAVDGASGGTVTSVTAGTGLLGGTITVAGTLSVDVGVGPNKIVQLDSSGKLPVIDGSALTNISAGSVSGTIPVANLPAFTGDVTSTAGSNVITLNTVPVAKGGTGSTTAPTARAALGAAASGANTDIISITNSTGTITLAPTGNLDLAPTAYVTSTAPYAGPLGSAAAPTFTNTTSQSTGLYFPNPASIALSTAGAPRLTIDSVGSIGVGITSPATSAILDLTSTAKGFLIPRMTTAERDAIPSPAIGLQIYNISTGEPNFYNGGSWQRVGVVGGSISSLNGLVTPTQTFAVDTASGTAPTWSSSGSVHTLQLPAISGASVTLGLLSKTDYNTFAAKQAALGYTPLNPANNLSDITNASTARGNLGLGTAATYNVGSTNGTIPVIGAGDKLPTSIIPTLPATSISNTAAGNLSATTVQAAINELDTEKVAKAGDTMTGALNLPSNGLNVGSGQLIVSGGNVGVGVASPTVKLDVAGAVRSNTAFYSTAADGFRIVQGNYGTFWRADGSNSYFLITNSGDQYGTWNSLRPLRFENATGDIWLASSLYVRHSDGRVGIGNSSPSEMLDVNGNVRATSFISTSDRRLKKNIHTVDGLETILKLRGVKFDWRSDNTPEYGTIAQEVEQVLPDLVVTDPKTGIKAVKYIGLIAPLIEATKDLNNKCDMSTEQIERIAVALKKVQEDVSSLKRDLASVVEENALLKEQLKVLNSRLDKLEKKEK